MAILLPAAKTLEGAIRAPVELALCPDRFASTSLSKPQFYRVFSACAPKYHCCHVIPQLTATQHLYLYVPFIHLAIHPSTYQSIHPSIEKPVIY